MKKKNSMRTFRIVFIVISVMCVLIFLFLGNILGRYNTEMINEVGTLYMENLNQRIEMHFKTTIEMQFEQLQSIVDELSDSDMYDTEELMERLAYGANGRNFPYLALYTKNGEIKMITGKQVQPTDPAPFEQSISSGNSKVAVGTDAIGNDIVLFAIKATIPMQDGSQSIAIIGGISIDYIIKTLSLSEDDALVYSHVIRRDGSFVIKSADTKYDNYFNQIAESVSDKSDISAESYVDELKKAMLSKKQYSVVLNTVESRAHLYCTALPSSEWYLITVMPYGTMDKEILHYVGIQTRMILFASGIILLMIVVIFVMYLMYSKQQMVELEKARKEAVEATKAKSEFLSNMSHDIRTPMNAIVGMTSIAAANIDDKAKVQNCLRKITLSSKHLLGLINNVLDMSKIESGKLTLNIEKVSLRELMDSIVTIVQPQIKAKKQNFNIDIGNVLTEEVYCDSVRLNQVLLNFMSNAIKFTPDGGNIQIALSEESSPLGDDYVRIHIRVKDNGIGMSEEFKKTIFDSFTREDNKRVHRTEGSGLGMAITKYIVDAMNGTVEVSSEKNIGTEFHVALDLEKATEQEEDMILPDWHMLVVDDDEQLCESVLDSLKYIGISAEYVKDGETAVELVVKRHKEHNNFQIILLDWKLTGIDGIETARRIRKEIGENTPLLLISAYDWSEIEQEATEAGINGFIAKPLFKSTLYYGLKKFVGDEDSSEDEQNSGEQNSGEQNLGMVGKRILIAEDNELNWEVATTLLEARGMITEWAENGKICVEKFTQSPVGYYDAILMDVRMPVMMGYEATRIIRALEREDADLPIIAMTADAFAEDVKKCMDCGMNAHIAKPIDVLEIERKISAFLKKG